jgi:hypothetical protein
MDGQAWMGRHGWAGMVGRHGGQAWMGRHGRMSPSIPLRRPVPLVMGGAHTCVRVCVVLVGGVLVGGRYKKSAANHEALVSTPWNFKIFSNS